MALSSTSTDAEVIAQYENNAAYWQSYQKAEAFCEALVILLQRFDRSGAIAGKSWTREDLTKLLDKAQSQRETLAARGVPGGRTHFTRGRAL